MLRSRVFEVGAFLAAAALGAGLMASDGPGAAAAESPAATSSTALSTASSSTPSSPGEQVSAHRETVWLPTGDVVSYDPAHPADLHVATRVDSGPGQAWRAFRVGGDTYVIPLDAAPFLGTVLDPSLFDVTAIAASGAPTVHADGTDPALPGLTVTGSGAGSESGTFTHQGAREFGAALQRAAVAASGTTTAPRTLFGASSIGSSTGPVIGSVVGSGASTPAAVAPQFQQQTVTFKALDADGQPLAFGFVFYGNLDDSSRGTGFAEIVDGQVKVSLPAGHYTLYSEDDSFTDTSFDARIVTQPDLVVTGATDQVVTTDFRTATARPTIALPSGVTPGDFLLDYERSWSTGGFGAFFFGDASGTVEIAPAPKPAIGTASLTDAVVGAGAHDSEYDAVLYYPGAIPADLRAQVPADRFAAVRERIFADGATGGAYLSHDYSSPDGSGFGVGLPVTLPLDRTDYLYEPSGSTWSDEIDVVSPDGDPFAGIIEDSPRVRRPGSSSTSAWLREAIAPQIPRYTARDVALGQPCPACRVDGRLFVAVSPFQDTTPYSHFGYLFDRSGLLLARTRLFRDGTLVDDEVGSNYVDARVPTSPASYTILATSLPGVDGFTLGSRATSKWTFTSAAGAGGRLPSGLPCILFGANCRILPLLQVIAPLPTDLSGTMGTGTHLFGLTVEPIQGAPAATTTARVQVSFDGERTWTDQRVAPCGRDRFCVSLVNPAASAGTTPSLRITGTDAAGGTIEQTITDAYRVAAG